VQMVSVPIQIALTLVPLLKDDQTVDDACKRLQGMLARKEATFLGWPIIWVRPGSRSTSETVNEILCPVEFDPPQGLSRFGSGGHTGPVRPEWGESVPTAFETRNIGATLEAEVVVADERKIITLTLIPTFSRFVSLQRFRKQPSPLGIEGVMPQPEFLNCTAQTKIRLQDGRPALLNVFVLPEPEPHVELFIVRASVTPSTGLTNKPKEP